MKGIKVVTFVKVEIDNIVVASFLATLLALLVIGVLL